MDTIKSKPSCRQIQLDDKEGSQELIQCTALEENKVQESIEMKGKHLSHFEPQAANNKQALLKLMVMKKILDKIQIETKTTNRFNN